MKRLLILSTVLVFLGTAGFADTIYGAGADSNLYTINPTTGATVLIGNMGVDMFDIAEYGGRCMESRRQATFIPSTQLRLRPPKLVQQDKS